MMLQSKKKINFTDTALGKTCCVIPNSPVLVTHLIVPSHQEGTIPLLIRSDTSEPLICRSGVDRCYVDSVSPTSIMKPSTEGPYL